MNYFSMCFATSLSMLDIFTAEFWIRWRTQITFQLIKLFFALTAAPFFLFTIGPLAKLFAHADPTAWTRGGRCVRPDPNGLSAYLDWLKNDVLKNQRFADELNEHFPAREVKRLTRAVVEGERKLANAWSRPSHFTRVTTAEKIRIDEMLAKIVTEEKASAALYKQCFPDKVLQAQYKADQEAEELMTKAANEAKKRKSRMVPRP